MSFLNLHSTSPMLIKILLSPRTPRFYKTLHRHIHSLKPFSMSQSQTPQTANKIHKHTNSLSLEHSPYLLQHAHNPVNWQPWGTPAFTLAQIRNVPIFLSIGYSTCHWCHVMEVESFESEEVAELLNKWFVPIKVDREERPDVDKVYMSYVQAVYGGGGWPLSVFLSPDLKPLMGGTYFPVEDGYGGRPGFKTVLRKVHEAWETKRDVLVKSGEFAIQQLNEALTSRVSVNYNSGSGRLEGVLRRCSEQLKENYDEENGGFGSSAPKFPRPVESQLMLYLAEKLDEAGKVKEKEAKGALEMVLFSLKCMASGGIHDHIGGGFHRYSVDEFWHVPHFEKMLYDQGQLVNVYLDAFAVTKKEEYAYVARDILDYLRRDMIGEEGGIYSAEDADSAETESSMHKKEGAFYIWTSKEIDEVLGEHSEMFKEHYYVKPAGNCDLSSMSDPHKEFKEKNVLIERSDASTLASKWGMTKDEYLQVLGMCRRKLYDFRLSRPRPHLDDKVIVSWNGLAISAFARASKILKSEPDDTKFSFPVVGCDPKEYLEVAERAASFIQKYLYVEETQRLNHSFRNGPSKAPGFLDDYAFLISGLLDLYEFGAGTKWLSWAIELQDTQDKLFLDQEGGGYYNTTGEDQSVLLRAKEDYDGAEPSGNSVSAINLVKLASVVSGSRSDLYKKNTEHLVAAFKSRLTGETAMAVPLMCVGADMLISSPARKQVVLVGPKDLVEFDNMLAAVHASYSPNQTVIHIDPNNKEEIGFWGRTNESIASIAKSRRPLADKVTAFVCQNFTCSAPVNDPKALEDLLH